MQPWALSRVTNQARMLTLIMLVASLLRFYGLENQSLWNDELSSWNRSNYNSIADVIRRGVLPDVHPPGYQVLLYFVEQFAGDSEAVLRLPSAFSGILTVYATFCLGRRLYSNKEGLIAAALAAVLWTPIYYSQEARPYSLLLLSSVVTTYLWLGIVKRLAREESPFPFETVGYVIASAVAAYLHYYGLFLVVLQGTGALLFLGRQRRSFLPLGFIYTLIGLAYLPWLPALWQDLTQDSTWITLPQENAFVAYLEFLFNQSRELLLLVVTLYATLLFRNLHALKRRCDRAEAFKRMLLSPTMFLVLWLSVPFLLVYIKSVISVPVLTNRNLIISLPAAYLLLARAITRLPLPAPGQSFVSLALLFTFLTNLLFTMHYYTAPHKAQFREAVQQIIVRDPSYQRSVIIGYAWNKAYLNYYFENLGSNRRVDILAGKASDIAAVSETIRRYEPQYVWYIRAHRKPEPKFVDFLNENLTLVAHDEFVKADVWLFEYKPAKGRAGS
ncbi:MAG TPA: glycosyltransferase family 39 protein [Anaerolineae bacterium]